MFPQAYLDFDLAFQVSNRGYEARVLNSPAGQVLTQFRLPFSEAEAHPLNEWFNTLDAIQTFGSQLFDTIFVGSYSTVFGAPKKLPTSNRQDCASVYGLRIAQP